jgi:hypothetical protein
MVLQEPTQNERDAFHSYLLLTSRLYPCGECAAEFQSLLKLYPPQVRNIGHRFFFDYNNAQISPDVFAAGSSFMVNE